LESFNHISKRSENKALSRHIQKKETTSSAIETKSKQMQIITITKKQVSNNPS
jgi:hypothetical protein